jgi:hypothetical protein
MPGKCGNDSQRSSPYQAMLCGHSRAANVIVEQHLTTCADCRIHAELVKRLEAGQWSPYRKFSLSPVEKVQIAHTFQFHLRRHPMRNTNIFSLLGRASLILILVIIFGSFTNTLLPTSPSTIDQTSPTPFTNAAVAASTPLPNKTLESNSLSSTPTPDVGNATDFTFEPGYQNRTDTVLVDLNCDGQNEHLLTAYRISTSSQEEGSEARDYLGVALQFG